MIKIFFLAFLIGFLSQSLFAKEDEDASHSVDGVADQVSLPITFQIKDHIAVSGYKYFLSDVAECSGYEKLCEEVYAIELGETPKPGRIVHYHRSKLLNILQKEWPQHTISVVGPQLFKISPVVYHISQLDVRKHLEKSLSRMMRGRSDLQVKIHSLRMSSSIKTLSQEYSLKFPEIESLSKKSISSIASKISGTPNLTVELYSKELNSESPDKRFRVLAKLDVSGKLPVALKPMSRTDKIDPLNFEYRWTNLTRTKNKFQTSLVSLDGYELKTSLKVGDPLPLGKVKKPEVIQRGEVAQMLIEKGSLTIKAKVKLRKSGSVGDVVEAEYLGTKKRLQVEILNKQTVKYRF